MDFEFLDQLNKIKGDEIDLIVEKRLQGDPKRSWVPTYFYHIVKSGSDIPIGKIDLRIGFNENTYYGGNIGYSVKEEYRGHHYAGKACLLIKQAAIAHGLDKVIITCNPDNIPSRKTCEYIGARLIEIVPLPPYNEQYLRGEKEKCVFEWSF
ncbi:GNAT family N-acetyltransferase [Peribacillus sp. SCS-37]|uniref:GNAT family N-acetyltransferase n=1 Tax=Paraperibacillus esterisolvens TaxID=3115296 RepID=UPI0039068DDB